MRALSTAPAVLLAILGACLPAVAAPDDAAERCRAAAMKAADRHAVPSALMLAIAAVESGRSRDGRVEPWPWTLNIGGEGFWLGSRAEALARARAALASGAGQLDLGCFQINHRWHRPAFERLDDMLDPEQSADYAARFLARLHAEGGSWLDAAGRYHSRTPRHFRRYRALVAAALANQPGREGALAADARSASAPDLANAGGVRLVNVARARGALLRRGRPAW